MHSVMCLAHMGQKDYKTYDENDPKHDIDMCALAEQQAQERKAAKAAVVNQISIVSEDDEDKEPVAYETYSASTTGEPIVIQATPFEPDAYDENGNPIVYIN